MKKVITAILFAALCVVSSNAKADNVLSADQLMKAAQNAVKDYAANEVEMSKSISGVHTDTVGASAQVTILMNSDGMKMTAKYLCVPQADDMNCNLQQ